MFNVFLQLKVPYNLKIAIWILVTNFSINVVSILLGIQEIKQKEEDDDELVTTSYEDSIVLSNLSLYIILIECLQLVFF